MDNEKIGKFIRTLRKDVGLTQKELAEKLGITDRAISKWERGLGCPDISLLESVANILNVSILELLKGEYLNKDNKLNDNDLIESMKLSKEMTINKFKKYFNIFTIVFVSFLLLVIVFQNLRNMYFVIKKHDTEFYYVDNSLKVKELNDKYELILSNQGNFNNNDYGTITSYINIMKKRLDEQNNDKYLAKENYDYFKVLEFYLDHQNFYTIEINNIDLYEILIQYDASIYKNIITYYDIQNSINRELSNILSFLQQPYFNYDITNLYKGIPNPYNIIENLYYSQILLCDDIIKVGELYEK